MSHENLYSYKIFNGREIRRKYLKLKLLKKALCFENNLEINENEILKIVQVHNLSEFYLLEYLINIVIFAPKLVSKYNIILAKLYKIPFLFKIVFKILKYLYIFNPIFRKYSQKIKQDLYLNEENACIYVNYLILELCSGYITDKIMLEADNIYLNFHFIQKWILDNTNKEITNISDIEETIINTIADGCSPREILKMDLFLKICNKELLDITINQIIPAKCGVDTIMKAMAVICSKNPNELVIKTYNNLK